LALWSECAILESLQLSQAGSKLARAASSCGVTFKLYCFLWFEIFGIGNIPRVFHRKFTIKWQNDMDSQGKWSSTRGFSISMLIFRRIYPHAG